MSKSAGAFGDWIGNWFGNGNWRDIRRGNVVNGVSPGESKMRREVGYGKPAPDNSDYFNVASEVKPNHGGEYAKAKPMPEYNPDTMVKAPSVDPNHIVGRPKPAPDPFTPQAIAEAFRSRGYSPASPKPVQGMARR